MKPDGKGINWSEINMPGRTVKSLQNQWTILNKKMEAYKQQSTDGSAPTTPAKKTPGRPFAISRTYLSELTCLSRSQARSQAEEG